MLVSEYLKYSQRAWERVRESDPKAPLRYGQALWHVLPDNILSQLVWGETDYYYWSNDKSELIDEINYKICEDYYV